MTHDEALKRVRKLLALAQSDNEYEAALALGRANALMERHRIEAAALDDSPEADEPVEVWDDPLDEKARATWKWRLAHNLAKANGCALYVNKGAIIITGRASNVKTVRYLYRYCIRSIDSLARVKGKGNGRTWMNNYRIGCVEAIGAAIKAERDAERAKLREATAGDSMALVRIDNAIARVDSEVKSADHFMRSKIRLVSGRGSSFRHDGSGRAAGRSDGAGIYGSGSRGAVGAGTRRIGG